MKKTALLCILAIGLGTTGYAIVTVGDAFADEGSAIVDAGIGSGSGSTEPAPPKPSDSLDNPVDDPVAAWNDLKAAKKLGWAAAILAGLVMAAAGLARAGERWPSSRFLAWFIEHKTVIFVVSGVGAVSAAAFNTLVLGGTMMAVVFAAAGAALAMMTPAKTGSA
jgi:hypothetical protein